MSIYKYKARDRDGLAISGELEVDNEEMLAKKLDQMGYILTSVKEEDSLFGKDIFESFRKVKSKNIVEFSVELSTLIEAGVPLLAGLEVLMEQIEDKLLKNIITQIHKDVSGGASFSEALSKHKKTFPNLYISMIRAGEATGELDTILKSLATFLEVNENNRSKVKAAMMYPMAMFIVSFLVVIFLIVIVLPNFVEIFKSAGVKLPLPTRIVLGFSGIIITKWVYIIMLIAASIYGMIRYYKTDKGRYYIDLLKFKIPIFGNLVKKSEIAMFTRTFGTLIRSSVPILQALDIVKDTANNKAISVVIENIRNSVRQGGSISEQLEVSGIFPKLVSKMVSVGEDSGALDKMLVKIADFYDTEVENSIKGLTSILEPIMIVGMGLVIGVIVLSVMLPMFDMMQVARR